MVTGVQTCALPIFEDLGSMIEQNINKVKGYSVFKFRITKFSANNYENINEYNVKVYNTDSPIANRIWVQDAVMEPEFKETLRDYAVKISNNTTEFTVNSEIGYSDGYVEMSIDGGDFVRGNTRTFTGLNLNRKNFEVVVRIHDGKGKEASAPSRFSSGRASAGRSYYETELLERFPYIGE